MNATPNSDDDTITGLSRLRSVGVRALHGPSLRRTAQGARPCLVAALWRDNWCDSRTNAGTCSPDEVRDQADTGRP